MIDIYGNIRIINRNRQFNEITFYAIGFPIARYFSGTDEQISFSCDLVLNVSGIQRPSFFKPLNGFFIPLGTFILIISIGSGMRFSHMARYVKESLSISLITFVMVPAIAVIGDVLPLKVVLTLSPMPVAFTALVASSIYNLDLDLANACWLFILY